MPICIYCLKNKTLEEFTTVDHVMPQNMGTFEPHNLTLINKVCDNCNNYCGINLEVVLARNTIEGLDRYKYGVEDPNKKRRKRKNLPKFDLGDPLKIVIQEGVYKGAIMAPDYEGESKIQFKFLPQVGFKKHDGFYEFYLLQDIPDKSIIDIQYPLSKSQKGIIILPSSSINEAIISLENKGIKFKMVEDASNPYVTTQNILYELQSEITSLVERAIAKIAFNYLAYHNETTILLEPAFNAIREFIRYGVKPNYLIFMFEKVNVPTEEKIHLVTIEKSYDGSIIGKVCLFNRLTYNTALAIRYPNQIKTGYGSWFDVSSRTIKQVIQAP